MRDPLGKGLGSGGRLRMLGGWKGMEIGGEGNRRRRRGRGRGRKERDIV